MKKFLRKIRLNIGRLILDKQTLNQPYLHVKKILFIRADGKIGDYIISSFAFSQIKKADKNITISVICTKDQQNLLSLNPYIDHLYFVRKKNIFDYIKTALILRKEKFDAIIDPTLSLRNRDLLMLRLIGAKNYIGYKKSNFKLFNLNIEGDFHFSKIYELALLKLGIKVEDATYFIAEDKQCKEEIERFLAQNHIKNFIAVNFFGSAKKRRFTHENIILLLNYLQKNFSMPIVILTYPEVTQNLKIYLNEKCFMYEKTKSIFHTISIIKKSSLVISPDTSIVHIASGLDKKLICFYNNDEENFTYFHPNSKNKTCIIRYQEDINKTNFTHLPLEF